MDDIKAAAVERIPYVHDGPGLSPVWSYITIGINWHGSRIESAYCHGIGNAYTWLVRVGDDEEHVSETDILRLLRERVRTTEPIIRPDAS